MQWTVASVVIAQGNQVLKGSRSAMICDYRLEYAPLQASSPR